jgi:hypothetical protein
MLRSPLVPSIYPLLEQIKMLLIRNIIYSLLVTTVVCLHSTIKHVCFATGMLDEPLSFLSQSCLGGFCSQSPCEHFILLQKPTLPLLSQHPLGGD